MKLGRGGRGSSTFAGEGSRRSSCASPVTTARRESLPASRNQFLPTGFGAARDTLALPKAPNGRPQVDYRRISVMESHSAEAFGGFCKRSGRFC